MLRNDFFLQLSELFGDIEEELDATERELATAARSLAETGRRLNIAEANLAEARGEVSAKTNEVESLTAALKTAEVDRSELEGELAAVRASLEEQRTQNSKIESELADRISRVASLEAVLTTAEQRAQDLNSSLADLREEASTVSDRLDQELSQKNEISSQLSEEAAKSADLQAQLSEEQSLGVSLTEQLLSAKNEVSTLSELLDQAELRNDELVKQMTEINEVIPTTVQDLSSGELAANYAMYRGRVQSLMSGGREEDYVRAKALLYRFFDEGSGSAFEGLSETLRTIEDATIALRVREAESLEHQNALSEVQRYIDYLSGRGASSETAQITFDSLSEQDLLYNRIFNGIRTLMVSSTHAADAIDPGLRFVGLVTAFWLGQVRAEVSEQVQVKVGDFLLIKRKLPEGEETTVAQGIVTAVDAESVEADIRLYFDENAPVAKDLVYLEPTTTL